MHPSFAAIVTFRKYNQPARAKPFVINTIVTRKGLAKIGRNKSVGPDGFPDEILKLGGEAMNPFLARIQEVSIKMLLSQMTGKKSLWFLFTKGVIDRQSRTIAP